MKKKFLLAALTMLMALIACPALAGPKDPAAPAAVQAVQGPGIRLVWEAPRDVPKEKVAGYNVYRSDSILGHYDALNQAPVKDPGYDDKGLVKGRSYFYRVTTVFADGTESKATEPVGMTAGAAQELRLPKIDFLTSNALGRVVYLGEEAFFVLQGDPGLEASLDIEGVAAGQPMKEIAPGTYKFSFIVAQGARVRNTFATGTLSDARGGKAVTRTPAEISLLGAKKPALTGLYAGMVEPDRVGLNWPRSGEPDIYYSIYRETARVVGTEGLTPISSRINGGAASYIDQSVSPGETYYYVLAVTDAQGNELASTENLEVKVPLAGKASGIETVEEDSGGKVLKPGDTLNVTTRTAPGGRAFFSLAESVRENSMTEAEPGIYRGSYTVKEGDGVFKSRVSVSFRDASGRTHFTSSATFVAVDAPAVQAAPKDGRKPAVYGIMDDAQSVAGTSGRLTAGRTFTVTITGEPGNKAYFSVGAGVWKIPMREAPYTPGTYTGSYTVKPGDSAGMSPDPLRQAYVTGWLESPEGVVSDPAASPAPVVIDTSCDIKVEVSAGSLPADARSQAKVTFTVTDADGQPVKDRRLTVLLEPPARYTGVVGGGGVDALRDTQDPLIGRLEVDFDDLTNDFGQVTATYTAGFAAKTAMVVARDFSTGSVGMGSITTSIASSVNVTLEPPAPGGAAVNAPDLPIYQLQIEVVPDPLNPVRTYPGFIVDAVPNTLTADGVSRANIIATLTTLDGAPVEGRTILFAVGGAGGRLTKSSDVTDPAGRAQVFYIAGTKAGKAVITATEPASGASVTGVITLLPDAPARIFVKAYPDVLPADGISTSRVVVEVADINNNPTDGVGVGFSVRGGAGKGSISQDSGVTDARGAVDFLYTAGADPGVATIDVTASSPPPSPEELKSAYSRVVAPMVYDNDNFTELSVLRWYKAEGEQTGRGEPLALVNTPLGGMTVYSPVSGTLDKITVGPGINVMEGKEIGIIR